MIRQCFNGMLPPGCGCRNCWNTFHTFWQIQPVQVLTLRWRQHSAVISDLTVTPSIPCDGIVDTSPSHLPKMCCIHTEHHWWYWCSVWRRSTRGWPFAPMNVHVWCNVLDAGHLARMRTGVHPCCVTSNSGLCVLPQSGNRGSIQNSNV
jgi:hypothetical protein